MNRITPDRVREAMQQHPEARLGIGGMRHGVTEVKCCAMGFVFWGETDDECWEKANEALGEAYVNGFWHGFDGSSEEFIPLVLWNDRFREGFEDGQKCRDELL